MRTFACALTLASLSVLTSAVLAEPAAAPAFTGYHVEPTLKIGGPGRWDYIVTAPDHMLWVTRSTHTQVIDPNGGKVIADVEGGGGLHGTAIVPAVDRAFITDGKGAKLLVVDTKTKAMIGLIDAANDADGIIYDAGSDRVLVSCGDAAQMLSLDPKADVKSAKVDKVDLDGKPEFLAADGKGHAFVCINDKNVIAVVDLKTLKVTDRWPCGPGTAPTGLAIDAKHGRLFVGCRNQKLIVMDSTSGKVLSELPIGKGNDACAFDDDRGLAFASCGDGTLAVVGDDGAGSCAVKQTITTQAGARTVTVDPETHKLYLPTAQFAAAEAGKRPAALPDSFGIVVVSPDGAH